MVIRRAAGILPRKGSWKIWQRKPKPKASSPWEVYHENIKVARKSFTNAYFSAGRIVYLSFIIGLFSDAFLSCFFGAIRSFALSTVYVASMYGITRGVNREPLVDQLVKASIPIDTSTVVRDLFRFNFWRGHHQLARQFLLEMKEADGTKFQEIMDILGSSRRGQKLAARYLKT